MENTDKSTMIEIIITVIVFIVSLVFFMFLRWYAGYDLLVRSRDNSFSLIYSVIFSGLVSFAFLMCYQIYKITR
jgi:hypothetical protein